MRVMWCFKISYMVAVALIVSGSLLNSILYIGAGCMITPLMGLLAD